MIMFCIVSKEKKMQVFNSNLDLFVDDGALRTLCEDSTEEDSEIKGVKELRLQTKIIPEKEKRPPLFGTTGGLKKEIIHVPTCVFL